MESAAAALQRLLVSSLPSHSLQWTTLSRTDVQEVLAGGGSGGLWWLLALFWALCLDRKAAGNVPGIVLQV